MAVEESRTDSWEGLAKWAAPTLLLITPFVIFLRHQEYPLLAIESQACLAGFTLFGLIIAAIGALFGNYLRIPLLALLIVVFADFQGGGLINSPIRVAQVFGTALVVGTVLRTHLSKIICVVCGSILIASILFPVSTPLANNFDSAEEVSADASLPPIVHIILDELIGIEGLPHDVDPDRRHADALKHFYLDRGFDVYGKAYSISMMTRLSLGTAMDFQYDRETLEKRVRRAMFQKRFGPNKYLNEMARRGYRIHVYQGDSAGYCLNRKGKRNPGIESCSTYRLEEPSLIGKSPMRSLEKANLLIGMYLRVPLTLWVLRERYVELQKSPWGRKFGLVKLRKAPRFSSVSAMPLLNDLPAELSEIEPGHMYLAHVLLPHYPYAFDEECDIRPDPFSWRNNIYGRPSKRIDRYRPYLAQVACTHKRLAQIFDAMQAAGTFDKAVILVHGDHGSRIVQGGFFGPGLGRNLLDKHSTLFAFRGPGTNRVGTYNKERLPLNVLLPEVMEIEGAGREAWSGETEVFLNNKVFVPLPDFDRGRILAAQ